METSTQRSTKGLQADTEHLTPEILISNSSTSTIIQEEYKAIQTINSNLLTASSPRNRTTDGLAIKLNCLKEKLVRSNSRRDFLSKCIQENFLPKRLEITLEPIIGNVDQDLLDNWYTNLNQISIVLMKQIVVNCAKTEQKTQKNINET